MSLCLVHSLKEGGSLQDRLTGRGNSALVPLTANERVILLSDVARGLAYLHSELCVIHRDVKSANVLLDEGCRDRICDFGIPKSLNDNNAVEAEAVEKECCICLKVEEVGKLLTLVSCGHRCVCTECSTLVVGHTCPVCRTETRQAIRVYYNIYTLLLQSFLPHTPQTTRIVIDIYSYHLQCILESGVSCLFTHIRY
jgi:serine/threonine protein kinase